VVVDKVLLFVYSPVITTYATSRNIIYAFRVVMTVHKDYIPHGINWLAFLMDKHSLLCEVVATFFFLYIRWTPVFRKCERMTRWRLLKMAKNWANKSGI